MTQSATGHVSSTDAGGTYLTVAEVRRETADAVSITFDVPTELQALFDHRAGQFLTVAVPSDRVPHVARCYSLSSAPGSGSTITVKRIDGGYASDWLNTNATSGLSLQLLPPSGHFTVPDPDTDVLLAAAGSGITPVMSILRWILEAGTGNVGLFYANRDRDTTIFAEELDRLAAAHPDRLTIVHWLEDQRGLPSPDGLTSWIDQAHDGDVWTCGPAPFMNLVVSTLGSTRHVHREEYRSLSNDPFAPVEPPASAVSASDGDADGDAARAEVEIDGTVHEISWPRDASLVDTLLALEVDVPYTCREGWCGSCTCKVEEGSVTMKITDALEADDEAEGYILGCQARPTSDTLRIVFD
ncbi:ferredoxin--NADP reductase [Rhodococcoides yunnanense]|uniref:ferredoxin--NADP reductase n=1 Tax=Rhodococcoides yunnanense TaxID=278209 RepID=UPI000933247F|nr:ferredoxin--NADP reductase [Rhodococcus yunnanensis]